VFGDSYADTGNSRKALSSSWKLPYGITFPGKPSGRFSDGRILTDYVARFLGLKSPIPYRWRKDVNEEHLKIGMNFAYAGTGVFETLYPGPNMTTQIGFFQRLLDDCVYTQADLRSSMALVALSGNDYSAYLARNGTNEGFIPFITQVVKELATNLKQIKALGIPKVVVTALQPVGCLPNSAVNYDYKKCDTQQNQLVGVHNLLLQQAVATFNNGTKHNPFLILDLYKAFDTVLNGSDKAVGSRLKFENPLTPCCAGLSSEYSCGSTDETGAKKYSVCNDPESSFFWDTVHPTQAGWRAIYRALQSTLQQLVK
jgi:phospholipase/lecithinase/hemolysin